jgi:cold-inducible RNA-binding protein
MAKKLYVGGLSYSTNDAGLKEAFAQAGNVESAVVITDKMSGRSKGFGFVEMATEEEAQKAMAMWNGKELEGRVLKVDEARPQSEFPPRRNGGGGGGGFGGRGGGGGGRNRW